ncbi:predicted protein [Lichtheimia corymbifera JMRC:FSU:9682]|uniref:BD-FAE-like domain-containing protein n=1 Tax=Lichtheimia corymbifera JMRC:FSU:9682 TaxID=1263082 RepID=A0A068RZG2_9FUNG|nr:predicted protein [Lichtheimia corymbifera JMRC:FSU:9682]
MSTFEVSTHAYTNDSSHYKQLDLYTPHAGSPHSPLLVFVHGGAWRSEDKADHRALAEAFVARGYPVAVTNYRLSLCEVEGQPPSVQHPAHIQDTLEAIEFLAHHPPKKNVYDPSKLYLIGHSAGGHIVTSLMLDSTYASKAHAYVRGVVGADAFGSDPSLYADASPVTQAPMPSLLPPPPMLIVHSLEDDLLDIAQANAMVHHLKNIGANVNLDTSVKGKHYDMLYTPEFYDLIVRFVKDNNQ